MPAPRDAGREGRRARARGGVEGLLETDLKDLANLSLVRAMRRSRAWRYLGDAVAIDTRMLAVFRIFLGLLIVADLLIRARTFGFFYVESGVVPQAVAQLHAPPGAFSLFYLTTSTGVIAALFALHALPALLLIVGYKTRVMTIACFVFVVSLDHHNPLVLSHADSLFRFLLFWAMFLPLGERWSVDAIHRTAAPRERIANVASAAILCQMLYMYLANAWWKATSEHWNDGSATPLIFGLDDMTLWPAHLLRDFPTLLSIGGWTWYLMLLGAWLLLVLRGRSRMALIGMFVLAHASFAVTVRIGAFPYVAIAGVLLFMPARFWRDIEALGRRLGPVAPLVAGAQRRLERAGRHLARCLPRLWPDVSLPRRLTAPLHHAAVGSAVIVVLVIPAIVHVGLMLPRVPLPTAQTPQKLLEVAGQFGVEQRPWTVFAPKPRNADRFYIMPALTADGRMLDLYHDRPLSYDRPDGQLQRQFRTYRERFYMNNVSRLADEGAAAAALADYICRNAPEKFGVEITHVNLYRTQELVTVETINRPEKRPYQREAIFHRGCGDHEPKALLPEDGQEP